MTMDWTKNAKALTTKAGRTKDRRLTVTITPEMEKVFVAFRKHYEGYDVVFTDTAILMTFIEAGVRSFIQSEMIPKTMAQVPTTHTAHTTPVHSND